MATYVLVHGGWHGGWCWKKVTPLLRAAGHEVYTPTLTGVGERSHLLSDAVDQEMHLRDIINVLEYEDLREVILVGHSYGGMVITGVVDRVPERIAHLVYLDAFVLEDGQSIWRDGFGREPSNDLQPSEPPAIAVFGVTDPEDVAWAAPRLTPGPGRPGKQPLRLGDPEIVRKTPRTFIECTEFDHPLNVVRQYAERVRSDPGWRYRALATGHDAMITAPGELADLLLEVAPVASPT
jgi:pimeloyl-ACP methyl ester carboxylesterase